MTKQKFVLSRDLQPPHVSVPKKACKRCGIVKSNDSKQYPMQPWGDRKIGKTTTGDTCLTCRAVAISRGMRAKSRAEADAVRLMDEDMANGTYLAKKLP